MTQNNARYVMTPISEIARLVLYRKLAHQSLSSLHVKEDAL
jgi:hypothetical protein